MKATGSDPVMEELGRNLAKEYDKRGASYREIEHALIPVLGVNVPTAETIRQYHLGAVSRRGANVMWIAAICEFYGVRVSDVSLYFAERAEDYKGVLTRSNCNGLFAGQELCGAAA